MKERAYAWLQRAWYDGAPGYLLLLPMTLLYSIVVAIRRLLYRTGWFRSIRLPVPVVVVGNIVAGGAGKTPVTLFIAEGLKARGWTPAIVSRGYGRRDDSELLIVDADSDARNVGDEPLLLARRSGCAVVVGADRVAASRVAVEQGADVIIADDGLQHYRLARDFEVCVVDASRGIGNGWQLPAGPLREPPGRLSTVDAILVNRSGENASFDVSSYRHPGHGFVLDASTAFSIDHSRRRPLAGFTGSPVHAVAGIGNPERFFGLLEEKGLSIRRHAVPDHAAFDPSAPEFDDGQPVLMTEKDAVKLAMDVDESHWYVPVDLIMDGAKATDLLEAIETRCKQRQDNDA